MFDRTVQNLKTRKNSFYLVLGWFVAIMARSLTFPTSIIHGKKNVQIGSLVILWYLLTITITLKRLYAISISYYCDFNISHQYLSVGLFCMISSFYVVARLNFVPLSIDICKKALFDKNLIPTEMAHNIF